MKRGQRRRQLRNLSQIRLNSNENAELRNVFHDLKQHAIVTAILGCALVEHELDALLRRRFKRRDDKTWELLVGENGPLSSLHSKILAGYAFGIYDEKLKDELNIIRVIRNTFAHSKRLVNFADPLIQEEIEASVVLSRKVRRLFMKDRSEAAGKAAYISLCYTVALKLMRRYTRVITEQNRRDRKKLDKSPILRALMAGVSPPQSRRVLTSLLSGVEQNDDPKSPAPIGLFGGLTRLVPVDPDKKDK
jgi:DNA-binding MltR family transcriptional regulator